MRHESYASYNLGGHWSGTGECIDPMVHLHIFLDGLGGTWCLASPFGEDHMSLNYVEQCSIPITAALAGISPLAFVVSCLPGFAMLVRLRVKS